MSLPVVGLPTLRAAVPEAAILPAVRAALIRHARGEVIAPPPGQLLFDNPVGDCHIKFGYDRGGAIFAVKIATGFYDNPRLGLAVNNGLLLVFDQRTGQPVALLQDEGWLTSMRTAAAGALAASVSATGTGRRLGILGAGHQARLQAIWAARAIGATQVLICGRDRDRSAHLAEEWRDLGVPAVSVTDVADLAGTSDVIITCTPARAPVLTADMVMPGTHIVALGADSPGKQELDPALFARARLILTDDRAQCAAHGDYSHALAAGLVEAEADQGLGDVLGEAAIRWRDTGDITICDLTGLPAQDVAMATLACERLGLLGGCQREMADPAGGTAWT